MKKRILFFVLEVLINCFVSFSNSGECDRVMIEKSKEFIWIDGVKVYKVVDVKPKFKENFNSFLFSKLNVPNNEDILNNWRSHANVQFVVYTDGTIGHLKAVGRNSESWLGKELMGIIQLTDGMWEPAWLNGEPVTAIYVQSIVVCLG